MPNFFDVRPCLGGGLIVLWQCWLDGSCVGAQELLDGAADFCSVAGDCAT